MSEMVERVARIIGDHYDGHADPVETPNNWTSAMQAARAAVEAMREPTEAQLDRFVSRALCVSVSGQGGWSKYARDQWQTMIDAALAPTEVQR